jgi:hypothetical protein
MSNTSAMEGFHVIWTALLILSTSRKSGEALIYINNVFVNRNSAKNANY